jgi:VanZ family protein
MNSERQAIATRIATLIFGLLIIAVVITADLGYGAKWWPFIDRIPNGDKLGHIGLFGTLGFLCNLAFPSRRFGRHPFLITTTTLVLLALISLEELSQAFIPTRSCDLFDWLADLSGLAIGQLAAIILKSRSPLKIEH